MTSFETTIRDWIASAQPDLRGVEEGRPGRPGRVPPHPPFARFFVASDTLRYRHEVTGLDGVTSRHWLRRALVRIDVWAPDSSSRCTRLLDYTRTAESLAFLDARAVAFMSSPSFGPHLTSEERSQIELVFSYRETYTEQVPVIEALDLTLEA